MLKAQLENVGYAFMDLLPGQWDSPEEAFRAVFGGELLFHAETKGWNCKGVECWRGEIGEAPDINGRLNIKLDLSFEELGRVILHELGHAIEVLTKGNVPMTHVIDVMKAKDQYYQDHDLEPRLLSNDIGWGEGDTRTRGMRTINEAGGYNDPEYWADTFYLWVLDEHAASYRDVFANDYMSDYLIVSLGIATP